ncbi:MAG TPA: hypothetical protein VFV39_00110 [Limnobacter sp.]|nr:hypothetical protein [Limnobacter sp.]
MTKSPSLPSQNPKAGKKSGSSQGGVSLVEALIAILILSGGMVLYAKNWTANFGAKNSTHVRAIAASQAAEIGNVLLANIADLDRETPNGEVISRVQQFSNRLAEHLNGFAPARGYECVQGTPRSLGTPNTNINLANATLPRTWAQGAAACVRITPLPNLPTNTNGVWVQVEAHWVDSHTEKGSTESVSVYTLVSPL